VTVICIGVFSYRSVIP